VGRPQHIETAPAGEKADHRETKTGKTDFGLERAIRPADEARCDRTKECVQHKVVQVADTDRKHQEIEQQRLDDTRRSQLRRSHQGSESRDNSEHEQGQREIAQSKANRCCHRLSACSSNPLHRQRDALADADAHGG
jgi:hypothetical protein